MDSWERFDETSLPPKKDFYSELILKDISDKDYEHAQKVPNKYYTDTGDYHDLYVQADTFLPADVFEKLRDTCDGIYGLDAKWENDLSKFNEDFIKNYGEDSGIGYFLEVDIEYPKQLFDSHKDLPFLPERRKLKNVEKCVCSIDDKEKYVIHIRALKQVLNHGLKLKNVHRVIKFQQKEWLKPYIDMNTKLGKEEKMNLERVSLS